MKKLDIEKLTSDIIDQAVGRKPEQTIPPTRDMILIGDNSVQIGGSVYIKDKRINKREPEEEP